MITERLTRITTGTLTAAALTGLPFGAGAVSTHHYIDGASGLDVRVMQERKVEEVATPQTGPAKVAGAIRGSDSDRSTDEYMHIPKVGDVRVDGQS